MTDHIHFRPEWVYSLPDLKLLGLIAPKRGGAFCTCYIVVLLIELPSNPTLIIIQYKPDPFYFTTRLNISKTWDFLYEEKNSIFVARHTICQHRLVI